MLPLKARILQYIVENNRPLTINNVMIDLASEYACERQFNRKRVQAYIDSFLAVSFLDVVNLEYDEHKNLEITFKISDYGLTRKKYLF